jgi:signal transduction histidine kinase
MFKAWRNLEISLAAKCQILFGAAVVLILGGALVVPWLRMEQLTDQITERSARALAETAKAQHLAWAARPDKDAVPMPSRIGGNATTLPVYEDGRSVAVPKLVGLWSERWLRGDDKELPSFERRAVEHLRKDPEAEAYDRDYETREGVQSLRFALALRAETSCLGCHAEKAALVASAEKAGRDDKRPATRPASVASTLPAQTQLAQASAVPPATLIGLVTVDVQSQVEANQQLLNRIFLLTAGLVAFVLSVVVFFVITMKVILRPVRVLRETAEKVSHGDLNVRSQIFTGDEFQHLSETFNVMLANLKESEDQLRAINKSLDLKLGQLAESNVALYESNRLKNEFLANVSHELRTPLNSILGFAELLRDAIGQSADGRPSRYVNNILQSGRNLLELINDLLDLAKIEAGRMEVRSAPVSVSDLFEGLVGILKPLYEKKSVGIDAAVAGDVPILQTDAAKLQQVLYNFLSNAIKFSPAGGRIDLRAERDEADHVRISVTDRGPGIEQDKQGIIFEKFRQIDGSVTREHGGTGLGLAISKELVTLLGGSIGVKSKVGEGSTFWVVLPVRIEAGAADVRGKLVLT